MNQNPLIKVLEANHLLRSPDEVTIFEQTLTELAQNPNPVDLPSLHLILDDACEQPEVMFSLVHFLESFDVPAQLSAFIQVLPDLVKQAAEWTAILHSRIMNDAIARSTFEDKMLSLDAQTQKEIYQYISSAMAKPSSEQTVRQKKQRRSPIYDRLKLTSNCRPDNPNQFTWQRFFKRDRLMDSVSQSLGC